MVKMKSPLRYYRKRLRRCLYCGYRRIPRFVNGKSECPRCGVVNVEWVVNSLARKHRIKEK